MPNGGSDCCGTCWFNTANEGQPGYRPGPPALQVNCSIRDLKIDAPYWTYCANHPHHNPERIEVPIGPVYVADDDRHARRILRTSPDTAEVRSGLLALLDSMDETPRVEYPSPTPLDEEVIRQLLEFREQRAVPALRRIVRFDPLAVPSGDNPFGRTRIGTVALAVEALATIARDSALKELETALACGLSEPGNAPTTTVGLLSRIRNIWKRRNEPQNDEVPDPMAAIRYHAVRGLKHCRSDGANKLLETATHDPHPEVAALARDVLDRTEADT